MKNFKMKEEQELIWEKDNDNFFHNYGENAKYMLEKNWEHYLNYFLEYFDKNIKKDNSKTFLLDVGCGAGLVAKILTEKGFKVYGVDFSLEAIKVAKKQNYGINFEHSHIYDLPFADKTFDVIICLGVFQTVSEQNRALAEMARALKKGGILVIRTLNSLSLYYRIAKKNNPSYNFYNPFIFKKMIEKNGFKVCAPKGIYFIPKNLFFITDLIIKAKIYKVFNFLFFPIFVLFSHSFYIEAKKYE